MTHALLTLALLVALLAVGGPAGAQPEPFVRYGMPKDAVWGPVVDAFCKRHGCVHQDTDMGSGEAITKFLAERGKPVAYATEAGITFARVAVERGAALAYKNESWDLLPAWAKDADGHWFAVYAGVPTFLVNPAVVIPSDEGQLLIAKAFPRPIRYVAGNLAVPADIRSRWLPDDADAGKLRGVTDASHFDMADSVQKWSSEVAP